MNTRNRSRFTSVCCVMALCLASCGKPAGDGERGVFVSVVPLAFLVERIGGVRIKVEPLVLPGQSPHTFDPSPQQLARLAQARIFFRVGVSFENALMPKLASSFKNLKVVDLREGLELRSMEAHAHCEAQETGNEKDHGDHEDHETLQDNQGETDRHHEEGEKDPHIWLSPRLAIQQATAIAQALGEMDPDGKEAYGANCAALIKDLKALDTRLAEKLRPFQGKTFMVFHPAWGYFADAYGLRQESIELDGKSPSAKHIAKIIDQAKAEKVRIIFVQPQFDKKSAQTIAAAIGGSVVAIDPLAKDYISNLEETARQIEAALR